MMYKAKAAVCSEIRTKHSTQSEHHVEFFNVKPGGTYKKPLGFKRLNRKNIIQNKKCKCKNNIKVIYLFSFYTLCL